MLPVLISQLVVVLKDSAIGFTITFVEMVRQGTVGSSYGNYMPALIVVALLMITVNFALSYFATWIEGRMRRSSRGPAADARGRARLAGRVRRAVPAAPFEPGAGGTI